MGEVINVADNQAQYENPKSPEMRNAKPAPQPQTSVPYETCNLANLAIGLGACGIFGSSCAAGISGEPEDFPLTPASQGFLCSDRFYVRRWLRPSGLLSASGSRV
jgi:hypothetical protein